VTNFTETYDHGFPANLANLAAVREDELAELLLNAWRGRAPNPPVQTMDDESTRQDLPR
jgi:hypothetical protein